MYVFLNGFHLLHLGKKKAHEKDENDKRSTKASNSSVENVDEIGQGKNISRNSRSSIIFFYYN